MHRFAIYPTASTSLYEPLLFYRLKWIHAGCIHYILFRIIMKVSSYTWNIFENPKSSFPTKNFIHSIIWSLKLLKTEGLPRASPVTVFCLEPVRGFYIRGLGGCCNMEWQTFSTIHLRPSGITQWKTEHQHIQPYIRYIWTIGTLHDLSGKSYLDGYFLAFHEDEFQILGSNGAPKISLFCQHPKWKWQENQGGL